MMDAHTFKITEIVGSSSVSTDDAIHNAIARASKTLRHLKWFEVTQTRGYIDKGKVQNFQVTLKLGFTLDDD